MANQATEQLYFRVSTGLKTVLGSELITDEQVAIFELVKNSFDADATRVDLYFDDNQIVIADNGVGMSYDDIDSKWLTVAYSSKRGAQQRGDFRDDIAERKHYAGSKGIGRFSSDRLGEIVHLQTRTEAEKSDPVHSVTVDWKRFDENHKQRFEKVGISYSIQPEGFVLPPGLPKLAYGTVITIEQPRQHWDNESLWKLKSGLAKLINPFGDTTDQFRIVIHAPAERAADDRERENKEPNQNRIINGEVGNFIFSDLKGKTTFIDVHITSDGDYVESTLIDRGELIYRIREPNDFARLSQSGLHCQIFFLNQSAKTTFTRRMGVRVVQFGSVFLFRNGFRVFPIGEQGDDWFRMDRRKQQGYKRFLGTRDVIGRIDVSGSDTDFQEASSRDAGLIETEAVVELRKFFRDLCLVRLENYVVPVTFKDQEDKNTEDISRLLTDPGRARVADVVARLVDDKNVELLDYSRNLIGILSERSAEFEGSLTSLRTIAEKTKDRELFQNIEMAERRFQELRESEERARKQADEERKAKEAAEERAAEAEKRAAAAESHASEVSEELEEEKKRGLFLTSAVSLDAETMMNLHHQVTIYAVDVQQQIENFLVKIARRDVVTTTEVINALEGIALLNRKVMGIAKFATKANFRLESEKINADVGEYIEQYITDVARDFVPGRLTIAVENDAKGFVQWFKPIDVSVVVDNLVANARKAGATLIAFTISHPSKDVMYVRVTDNGRGFAERVENLERVFEKGFTTTDGSGLGLFHVRQVLGEMNGTIEALKTDCQRGASFLIRISKGIAK